MTYIITKKFPIPIKRYVMILSLFLIPALFLERYFFIVAVYKSRNYGYILLLTVLFFNTIFLYIMQILRRNKEKKSLSQQYSNDIKPKVSNIIIFIVAIFDTFKSLLLFWSANTVTPWMLIALLQLYIPLNMFLRSCCIENISHYLRHWVIGLLIFTGCVVSLFTLQNDEMSMGTHGERLVNYVILLIISQVCDVISNCIKEALVRSQPMN